MKLRVTSRSGSSLPVPGFGVLSPNRSITRDFTATDIERLREQIEFLRNQGLITFEILEVDSEHIDDNVEVATVEYVKSRVLPFKADLTELQEGIETLQADMPSKVGITDVNDGQLYRRSGDDVVGWAPGDLASVSLANLDAADEVQDTDLLLIQSEGSYKKISGENLLSNSSSSALLKGTFPGPLSAVAPNARWYPPKDVTLLLVYVSVGVASGNTTTFRFKKNGVAFANVSLDAGEYRSANLTLDPPVACLQTDYVTLEITQANGGADGVAFLEYR